MQFIDHVWHFLGLTAYYLFEVFGFTLEWACKILLFTLLILSLGFLR